MSDLSDFSSDAIRSAVGQSYGVAPKGPSSTKPSPYATMFADAGQKHGVDPNLLAAIAQTESSGNPHAVSKDASGRPVAHGLMQLTLPTAHALGVTDPYDPAQSIDASARLMRQNLDASGGDTTAALKMYHGGTNQDNWGPKTSAYPGKVATNITRNAEPSKDDAFSDFSSKAIGDEVSRAYGDTASSAKSAPSGSPSAQHGQRIMADAEQMRKDLVGGNLAAPGIGVLEGAGNIVSGMGSSIVGGLAGGARTLYNLAAGEGLDKSTALGAQTIHAVQDAGTYQPRTAGGKLVSEVASVPMSALKEMGSSLGGDVGQVVNGQQGRIAGEAIGGAVPDVAGAVMGGRTALARPAPVLRPMPDMAAAPVVSNVPAYIRKAQTDFQNAKAAGQSGTSPATPVGVTRASPAATAAQAANQTPVSAPPNLASSQRTSPAIAELNPKSVEVPDQTFARNTEASSLPVPIALTKGQASGDVNQISRDQNMRGKNPDVAQRFNEQNGKLIDNVNSIRESSAPDITAVNHVENGQTLIDSYKTKDAALSEDISAKYKALEDANGGQFPVNGKAFVEAADAALAKKMKGRYVPPEVHADMDAIRNGGPMTYENFENMRTNLAAEARKAERAGDGNRAMATSIVRDALESIPMEGETAAIKPIADAARNAAKARFDLIDSDPAYKAAINDSTKADDFINKFVINGKVEHVKTMRANLADDPLSGQTIAAGTINYLKNRAGLVGDTGNFSQAGYNKALSAVSPKLQHLFEPQHAQLLQTLGHVARYTQEQPRGSWVNNSNTFVAGAAKFAKGAVEGAVNVAAKGVPVGTWIRNGLESRAAAKEARDTLAPGPGVKLSEFPK